MNRSPYTFSSRARNSRSGFTLVEVLAAMLIFSIGVVSYMQGMGISISSQTDLLARNQASRLAQNVLEETMMLQAFEQGFDEGSFEDIADENFSWETTITQLDEDGLLLELLVVVSWSDGATLKEYQLATWINPPPVEEGGDF